MSPKACSKALNRFFQGNFRFYLTFESVTKTVSKAQNHEYLRNFQSEKGTNGIQVFRILTLIWMLPVWLLERTLISSSFFGEPTCYHRFSWDQFCFSRLCLALVPQKVHQAYLYCPNWGKYWILRKCPQFDLEHSYFQI